MIKARSNRLNEPIERVSFEVSSVIVSGSLLCKSLKKQPVNYLHERGMYRDFEPPKSTVIVIIIVINWPQPRLTRLSLLNPPHPRVPSHPAAPRVITRCPPVAPT